MSENQYAEIVRFIRNSNYTKAVTHQDVNPINEHDCTMLIIEYTQNMTAQLERAKSTIEQTRKAFKKILKIKRTIDMNLFDIEEIHSIAQAALSAIEIEATDGK